VAVSNFIRISEAASIGFHTAAYLSQHTDRLVSSHEIAKALGVSEHHLSKVLQRLAHSGIVQSTRGPNGGFRICPEWEKMKLVRVFEAIEGPLTPGRCFLSLPACKGNRCALGTLVHKADDLMRKCLADTTLAEMAKDFHPGE